MVSRFLPVRWKRRDVQRVYVAIEKQPRDDREEYADTAHDEQTVGIRENKGLLTKS